MVEISLLGEEEAEKVDEDVQVSRFELVKFSHPQLTLDPRLRHQLRPSQRHTKLCRATSRMMRL
jgi:hypothetical protein